MWTAPNSTDAVHNTARLQASDFRFLKQGSWIALTLLVLVLVSSFWRLSDWQFHRLEHRRASNAAVQAASAQQPVPLASALSQGTDLADWTPVTVQGTWLSGTAMARKHWRDDVMGFWAVSRLHTTEGTILVVRGWLPTTKSAATTPRDPGVPELRDTVLNGWLVTQEVGDTPADMPRGQITRVNAASVNNAIATPAVNMRSDVMLVIDHARTLQSSYVSSSGLYDITPPNLGDGPHHSYAWQWRAFIVLVLVGWARLVVTEARGQQRRPAQAH